MRMPRISLPKANHGVLLPFCLVVAAAFVAHLAWKAWHCPKGWPDGATALCRKPARDGKAQYSYAKDPHRGACSGKGGVKMFADGSGTK